MIKTKRTKDDPLITTVYLKGGQRRQCRWWEDGKHHAEYLSRYTWRRIMGEIPAGCFIRYKDGDKMNDCVENYELVNRSELASYNRFLKQHDRMDRAKKNKYSLRWMELKGSTALEKLYSVLIQYGIKNFHQLSELSNIDEGQLNRIKNKNTGLGMINIKRLFDALDKKIV